MNVAVKPLPQAAALRTFAQYKVDPNSDVILKANGTVEFSLDATTETEDHYMILLVDTVNSTEEIDVAHPSGNPQFDTVKYAHYDVLPANAIATITYHLGVDDVATGDQVQLTPEQIEQINAELVAYQDRKAADDERDF